MRNTVESINDALLEKFEAIEQLFVDYHIQHTVEGELADLRTEFHSIYDEYLMNSSSDIIGYYNVSTDGSVNEATVSHKYYVNVESSDTINQLCMILTRMRSIMHSYHVAIEHVMNLKVELPMDRAANQFESCNCTGNSRSMTILSTESELKCDMCGQVKQLCGTVFEDQQFYNQDGKTKHTTYEARRHYITWMDKIQAKEVQSLPVGCIDAINRKIKRDKLPIDKLTCEHLRSYLKECKMTDLNSRVVSIHREITKKVPPQLTTDESQLMSAHYAKVVSIYNKHIKSHQNQRNQPYYPFIIYKIIEVLFKNNPEKLKLLHYIHLQNSQTNRKHDRKWKVICEHSNGEYAYIPTDIPL
jgi:hypothetical protein